MKQTFTLMLLIIIRLITYGQADSIYAKQFSLTGRIIEKVQMTPHCGIVAWGTVVEFEVIDLVGMSYQSKRIGIIITCPEFYKNNFFEKGKVYQVVFSDKNQAGFEWSIPNKDLLKKNNLSFEPYSVTVKKLQ